MSIKIMTRVWEESKQGGSKLLLLLAIADNANDDGFAWPGQKYLAHKIRMSERSISRLAKELEESGELYINRRNIEGQSNQYLVSVEMSQEVIDSAINTYFGGGRQVVTPDIVVSGGVDIAVSGGVDKGVTLTVNNHQEPSNTPNGKNGLPDLNEHQQDELMVFGLYGNSSQQPADDSIEAEIINSGWLVESPLVLQALIKFLLACREVGLGLQIPKSDSRRGDWFSHLSAHVDDFGIDELAERYRVVLTRAKDDGWLNKIGRPGSLDKTLPTVQVSNGHKTIELF